MNFAEAKVILEEMQAKAKFDMDAGLNKGKEEYEALTWYLFIGEQMFGEV